MRQIGASFSLHVAEGLLEGICSLTYSQKVAEAALIQAQPELVDPWVAQMGGFLQAWCNITSPTSKAKSIERFANSHANSWAIGPAQGASSWRAFREFGTQAIIPANIAVPNITAGALARGMGNNIARLNRGVAPARRAPGTEGRVKTLMDQARDDRDAWKVNAQVAVAVGKAPPPAPPALDLSAAF